MHGFNRIYYNFNIKFSISVKNTLRILVRDKTNHLIWKHLFSEFFSSSDKFKQYFL